MLILMVRLEPRTKPALLLLFLLKLLLLLLLLLLPLLLCSLYYTHGVWSWSGSQVFLDTPTCLLDHLTPSRQRTTNDDMLRLAAGPAPLLYFTLVVLCFLRMRIFIYNYYLFLLLLPRIQHKIYLRAFRWLVFVLC